MSAIFRRSFDKTGRFAAVAVSVAGLALGAALAPAGAQATSSDLGDSSDPSAVTSASAPSAPASRSAAGADIRDWSPVSIAPLPTVTQTAAGTAAEPGVVAGLWRSVAPVCVGSGTDGARVQVVYAREASTRDRFAQVESAIRAEIGRIDSVVALSARKTGGGRQVRWVAPNCNPSIVRVVVPDGTFSKSSGIESTESALAARGMAAANRKYLVFADSTRACGVSTIYKDSSATNNANDGRHPQYARVDAPCWNSPDWSVAAHELVHTLGGVQPDAPNALGRYHCDDANDLMCYRETPATKLRVVCGASHVGLLDCNNDDYFNTAPRKGTYLASRWNVANSSFLQKTTPLSSSVGPRISASTVGGRVRLSVPTVQGAERYRWSGPALATTGGIATTAAPFGASPVTYRLTVEMADGVEQTSVVTVR